MKCVVLNKGEQAPHYCDVPDFRDRYVMKLGRGAIVQCTECNATWSWNHPAGSTGSWTRIHS